MGSDVNLRLDDLSESDLEIHCQHSEAVANIDLMYDDTKTGLKVLTRLQHKVLRECVQTFHVQTRKVAAGGQGEAEVHLATLGEH